MKGKKDTVDKNLYVKLYHSIVQKKERKKGNVKKFKVIASTQNF